jgi:ABC-type phosphate transport system substrate-binding protein
VIKGGGGEVGLSAYGVRGVTYRYVTDQIVWLYRPFLNASEGLETYNSGALDFLSLDAPVPGLPERQLLLPLMAGAIAITYNLPPSTSNGTSSQGISLVLDRRLLARIWLGEVSQWSHPDIARLNPELVPLPDEEIRLAWLPGLGVTQVFAHALASFIRDDDPAAADELSANGTLAYLPPVVDPTRGSEGFNTTDRLLAYMNETPFSLGYFVHDSYYTALSPSIAQLVNKASTFPSSSCGLEIRNSNRACGCAH